MKPVFLTGLTIMMLALTGPALSQSVPPEEAEVISCRNRVAGGQKFEGGSDQLTNCLMEYYSSQLGTGGFAAPANVTVRQMQGRAAPPVNFFPQPIQPQAAAPAPARTAAPSPAPYPVTAYPSHRSQESAPPSGSGFAGGVKDNASGNNQAVSPAENAAVEDRSSPGGQIYIQSGQSGGAPKPIYLPR